MKTDSRDALREMFQSPAKRETWYTFLQESFQNAQLRKIPQPISVPKGESKTKGYCLGEAESRDHMRVGFFWYEVPEEQIARRRVGLRNLARPWLNGEYDALLAVFTPLGSTSPQWRLSLICDLKAEAQKSTTPKRFSYIFGDKTQGYRTPVERFTAFAATRRPGDPFDYSALREAFSVEALSKSFYNELFAWYQWALSPEAGITFPNDTATAKDDREGLEERLIRLITRLIFVWFLKQKHLVPDDLFRPSALANILRDFTPESASNGNYYNAILQNLFFATLNKEIADRAFASDTNRSQHYGIKTLYRDNIPGKADSFFLKSHNDIISKFRQVPFLNGGLFECLDKPKADSHTGHAIAPDGFSREAGRQKRAFIPNLLFFAEEEKRTFSVNGVPTTQVVSGLLSLLKRYHFTIVENAPNDVEVALDPELLGTVFETLLGSYNPETRETARKASGSFYTPRPIVAYMVDEALKAYLAPFAPKDVLEKLFDDGAEKGAIADDVRAALIEKIYAVRSLDPACGSGAFPMGLLSRMVALLEHLGDTTAPYQRKLKLIEQCIYGIDIQPIAVQIAKLRFFISLVCEEEPCLTDCENNYGIRALPNLETRFVVADSLIGKKVPDVQGDLFLSAKVHILKKALAEVRKDHFTAPSAAVKTRCRDKDKRIRSDLMARICGDTLFGLSHEDARQLAEWNPYDQNTCAPFFDPEWMFNLSSAAPFDIVIGNPPYISTKGVSEEDGKRYTAEFGFSDDTYNLFFVKGVSLLKPNGILSYITPKTYWSTQTKQSLRKLILSKTLLYLYDTANPFEAAMVDTCITSFRNAPPESSHTFVYLDGSQDFQHPVVYEVAQTDYSDGLNAVIFPPTPYNLAVYRKYGPIVKKLYQTWWDKIKTSRDIEKNRAELEAYRASLKPGDVALLGCLTEGGQGLATADNGRYIAIRMSSKWAANTRKVRVKKLKELLKAHKIAPEDLDDLSPEDFLATLSECQITERFDGLKAKYGIKLFGKGFLFRLINDSEIVDVDTLSEDEKANGIDPSSGKPFYVPYDKGDKDGNRWYLETPFAIAWTKENVHFLKSNSGKKGEGMPVIRNPQFYFREGFCWSDINTTFLKCRIKTKSIHDVKSMSLFGLTDVVPECFLVSLINSRFMSRYVDNFVNNTQTFQINDARQLPVVIPKRYESERIVSLVKKLIALKQKPSKNGLALEQLESQCEVLITSLYGIEFKDE